MNIHTPERGVEEDFNQYRMRRAFSQMMVKTIIKGKLFWDSSQKRTYRKLKVRSNLENLY